MAKGLTEEEIKQILSDSADPEKGKDFYVAITQFCDVCSDYSLGKCCKVFPKGIPDDIYKGGALKRGCLK